MKGPRNPIARAVAAIRRFPLVSTCLTLIVLALTGCAPSKSDPVRKAGAPVPLQEELGMDGETIAHDFFLRARRMELEGNDAVALGYYRIAFEYDPDSRDLCFILVDRLKNAGKVDTAIHLGERCLALPGEPGATEHQTLGEAYLRKGDLESARFHYEEALAQGVGERDVLYTLANLYESERLYDKYTAVMERLLPQLDYPQRMVEKVLHAYRMQGRVEAMGALLRRAWEESGKTAFGENLAVYHEARDENEDYLETARALRERDTASVAYGLMEARALDAVGKTDSALAAYAALEKAAPDEREILFPFGTLLLEQRRFPEARQKFQRLVKSHPAHPAYHYFLGVTALEMKQDSLSRDALEKAADLEPDVPDYWARLIYRDHAFRHDSLALSRLERLPDSLTAEGPGAPAHFRGAVLAQVARRLEPPPPGERHRPPHSDSVWARRHREEAVRAFRLALKADPANKSARFELGVCLERLGRIPESLAELRMVVQQDSLHATALNYLGYMLVEQNQDLDYAGKLIQKALELEPSNGAFLDSKGWWHYRRGEYTEAKALLEQAHERLPDDTTILEHLAIVNELLGDKDAARAAWKHVLQIDPGHAEAKRKTR